jgi:hypothetical protein
MKFGWVVFSSVKGGGGVAIVAKGLGGGSTIGIEYSLNCFSILLFIFFGKTLIILGVVWLVASIVGVMSIRVVVLSGGEAIQFFP